MRRFTKTALVFLASVGLTGAYIKTVNASGVKINNPKSSIQRIKPNKPAKKVNQPTKAKTTVVDTKATKNTDTAQPVALKMPKPIQSQDKDTSKAPQQNNQQADVSQSNSDAHKASKAEMHHLILDKIKYGKHAKKSKFLDRAKIFKHHLLFKKHNQIENYKVAKKSKKLNKNKQSKTDKLNKNRKLIHLHVNTHAHHHASDLDISPIHYKHSHKHDFVIDSDINHDMIKPFKAHNHYDFNTKNTAGMTKFVHKRAKYRYPLIGGNTRDLGGYYTKSRKYIVIPDRIIRSADLNGIDNNGINELKHLNINKVIDLRYMSGKNGIQGHPDPDELHSCNLDNTNIQYENDPVYTHKASRKLIKDLKHKGINSDIEYYFYGPLSVSNPHAIKAYKAVFTDLLNNKHGAILYHCNLGRDRTGTTSALILSALGVDRNTIYHDYLLTDHYKYKYDGLKHQPYSKQAGELQYFFNTIDRKYGSVHNYLNKKIGLSHNELQKLRKTYTKRIK